MEDLADRLDAGVEAMIEMGPQLAAGEPWAYADLVGPGPESSWGPREVLAHVAEMLPFWLGEIELILDGAGGEPPAFGRLEDDDIRVAIITRDSAERLGLIQVKDESSLEQWVDEVIAAHPKEVERYRAGEGKLLGFLVGQVMKRSQGKADPKGVQPVLVRKLAI